MSAAILVGIVVIWIAVLVPMWLNRHEANATRSMDSFSTAMRVLSRRAPGGARGLDRYVVMPRRESWGVTVDNHPQITKGRGPAWRRVPRAVPVASSRARLLARRRRVMSFLAVISVAIGVAAAMELLSWLYELAVGLLFAAYVVHLRNEAIRFRELRRRQAARAARASAAWDAPTESGRRPDVRKDFADAVSAAASSGVAAAASGAAAHDADRWEPIPVPLPTYVSKPVVSRPVADRPAARVAAASAAASSATAGAGPNTIDLTRPGAWTDAQVDVRHLLLDESPTAYGRATGEPDDELDVILERRRVVGG